MLLFGLSKSSVGRMLGVADVSDRWGRLLYFAAVPGFRFSGECPGRRESTTVRLIRPDDLLGHLSVQDRLYVSTTVVSAALQLASLSGDLTFRS